MIYSQSSAPCSNGPFWTPQNPQSHLQIRAKPLQNDLPAISFLNFQTSSRSHSSLRTGVLSEVSSAIEGIESRVDAPVVILGSLDDFVGDVLDSAALVDNGNCFDGSLSGGSSAGCAVDGAASFSLVCVHVCGCY